jgi:hypothetical protein
MPEPLAVLPRLQRSLRWQADDLVTNDFGERVWLKEAFDENARRIGITDCCFADDACMWHRAVVKSRTPEAPDA